MVKYIFDENININYDLYSINSMSSLLLQSVGFNSKEATLIPGWGSPLLILLKAITLLGLPLIQIFELFPATS